MSASFQVSYDDRSLLGIDWSFFVFYLVVLGGTIFFNFVQHKEMGQQPLVRIYGLVLLLFWLAFFCDGIHWAVYPRNGLCFSSLQLRRPLL